jgi:hypothetical protein
MSSDIQSSQTSECQICLDPGARKVDTTLFNCNCTFYSHIRCFIKFIDSQQRYKTYLDCPICHSRVNLNESRAIITIIAQQLTNGANEDVQHRLRSINILIVVICVYLFIWLFIIGKKILAF